MKDIRNQIASEYSDAVKEGNEKRGLVSQTAIGKLRKLLCRGTETLA